MKTDRIIESEDGMHGCCQKNKLSICLCIFLTFTLLTLLVLAFSFVGYLELGGASEEECTSLSCVRSAAEISEYMDSNVDPCEDFYEFVCGKFIKTSYEKQTNNLLNAERDRIKRHMDNYIIAPPSEEDPRPVKMQKSYFRACLNEDEIDEDQDRTFLKKLNEISEWPILRKNSWDDRRFDWVRVMIKARNFGLPFEWFLKMDLHNEDDHYTIKLTHPDNCGITLSEDYVLMRRGIIEQLMTPVMDTIFELRNLTDFERKLNSICENMTDFGLSLERVSDIQWETYAMGYFLSAITGIRWRPNTEIAIERHYIQELNKLLRETPKMVQANYILWKIVEYFAPYLSKPIRNNYTSYLGEDISRFDFCLQDTKTKFKFISEIVDLREHDQDAIQEEGEVMLDTITNTLLESIENVKWRSNKTKETHLDLFENVEVLVGGSEEMFEDNYFLKYSPIGKLIFLSDNIIQMLVDWSDNMLNFKLKMIGKQDTPSLDSAYSVNSDFVVMLNEDKSQMILPATVFDSFLHKIDGPQYLNYAGLGSVISTELVRGLHLLEKNRHESFAGFEDNKKCFIEDMQKSNKIINASLLFSLNYESLLGQDLAYRAYRKYVEENEEEEKLVNVPYTPQQLFWIKTSLNWCYRPLPDEETILDMQEILKYRIVENVKNSAFFAEDFNCPSDAPMNPPHKCSLL